jgi:hypothetical protein
MVISLIAAIAGAMLGRRRAAERLAREIPMRTTSTAP